MLLWLFLLAIPIFLVYMEARTFRTKWIVNRIKGPPTLPLVGNALQIGKTPDAILDKLFCWWREYGKDNYRIWVGYFPLIVVTNVKDVEFILTSNTFLKKHQIYRMLHPWLGTGLLTSDGAKWHKHRKMITPSFHFKILHNFHDVMNTNCNKFIKKLCTISAGDNIFDFQEVVHYLTLDIICDTAMGVHINAIDNHDSDIVTAFKDMCYNINVRAFHPLKRNTTLYQLSSEYPHYKKTLKILQDFTYDVIEKRIKAREIASASVIHQDEPESEEFDRKRQAFLDTLLTSTIDGKPLSLEEVYEEVSTFMFEGHDTTTSGIAFAVYLLSRHATIQEKVYAEQQGILGVNLKRDATFQEISEMKYLDLVLKESLRLYPSVPVIGRMADKDYNMNGTVIPKDAPVNLFLMAMGYNEKIFPDPYRVRPERFDFEHGESSVKLNPFAYVPFSAGPRNCIGQKFAWLELKTVVSKVVRYFEILPPLDELASDEGFVQNFVGLPKEEQPRPHLYDPVLSAVLTLKSENGLHLRLRERL